MRIIAIVFLLFPLSVAAGNFQAVDDVGKMVSLDAPPGKIVSLAPHLTELLFSLGVGDRIVATVQFSDFPPAAKEIPRLGDAFSLSVEAIVDMSPDLILSWTTGGNQRTLTQLQELGYAVYQNEASNLEQIAATVERIGRLVGKAERGAQLGAEFRQALAQVGAEHQHKQPVKVFFQISDNQLYTFNDTHLIGQAIRTCGGTNAFGDLAMSVPLVSLESVIESDPDVILVASPYEGFTTRWSDEWARLGWQGRIRYINASLITRPGLRMLEGVKIMCQTLREQD